jgi:CHAT domain-containing protein
LHIATHSFFLQDLPPATPERNRAGALPFVEEKSAAPTSGLGENPLLGTQLVVLSACETGLGDVANGEGVYGLQQAFALAGAETQLISLWKVSDDGTKDLMVKYYDRLLNGVGRSEALLHTQREFINDAQYRHPYYWASFIPTGDWRPMK